MYIRDQHIRWIRKELHIKVYLKCYDYLLYHLISWLMQWISVICIMKEQTQLSRTFLQIEELMVKAFRFIITYTKSFLCFLSLLHIKILCWGHFRNSAVVFCSHQTVKNVFNILATVCSKAFAAHGVALVCQIESGLNFFVCL